jgi:acetate kinase
MMQGNALVINCGSSAVNFAVIVADNGDIVAKGSVEWLFQQNQH